MAYSTQGKLIKILLQFSVFQEETSEKNLQFRTCDLDCLIEKN